MKKILFHIKREQKFNVFKYNITKINELKVNI